MSSGRVVASRRPAPELFAPSQAVLIVGAMPVPVDAPPSATLIWDGGQLPACDRGTALRRNVSVYLGRDPFEDNAPLTIRVGARRAAETGAVVADVSEVDDQGHILGVRSVSGGTSCETLDEPLTLVVALMLDETPRTLERRVELPPQPPEPPERRTDPGVEDASDADPTSNVPENPAEEAQPAHAFLSAGIATSFGKLPFFNFGPRLQAVFKPRRFWGLELSAGALGGAQVELPGSGRMDFLLLEFGAALCPLESFRDGVLLRACGGITVGWLRAESHDLDPSRRRTEIVLSPELHLQVGESIGKNFLFGGGAGAAFPIRPNQYVYRDPDGVQQVAFQMSLPSVMLELFVARRFP